jgi:hypothetical protein
MAAMDLGIRVTNSFILFKQPSAFSGLKVKARKGFENAQVMAQRST